MSERTEQDQRFHDRSMAVRAYGNTADEIEQMPLAEARKFFGADVRLEVVRDYKVLLPGVPAMAREAEERGATYWSNVTVRVVEES